VRALWIIVALAGFLPGCLAGSDSLLDHCLDYCELMRYCNNASDGWTRTCNELCYLAEEPGFSKEPKKEYLDCVTDETVCSEFLSCAREASGGALPGDPPDEESDT
jgi:hypothetical protein